MSWIESHQALSRHRKTIRVVALLKVDRHKLIGHLHELWWWALDNATIDGLLVGLSDDEVAHGAEWPAKDGQRFINAMVSAGFLDRTPEGLVLHDWYEFAGKLLAKRAANKERMQRTRAEHVQRTNDARVTHGSQGVHGLPTNLPTNLPTTSTEQCTDEGVDPGFRDRLGTLEVFTGGGRVTESNHRKYVSIAEDFTQAEIDAALKQCTLDGVRGWPNEVVERLPKRGKPKRNSDAELPWAADMLGLTPGELREGVGL